MRYKYKILGSNTYFHHENGVVFRKKASRVTAFYTSTLLAIGGAFFITTHFILPAIKNINLQNTQTVFSDTKVLAEPKPGQINLPEIKQENEDLKASIKAKLSAYPKEQNWSVYMFDPDNGQTVNINSDRSFASAGLYKLFLLEPLENKIPFDKWAKTRLSNKMTIKDCVEAMLKSSDDPCAELIGEYINWQDVDSFNKESGFVKTRLSGFDGRQTDASELGELFLRLKKGQILSDKARRFVFDALYQQVGMRGIIAGCNNCRTATKSGELTDITHEAGIVTHGNHSYILVVMSQGGSSDQISEITRAVENQ